MLFKRIKNLFRNDDKKPEIKLDYEITDLKKGWILDYDLTSWEVQGVARHEWGNGSVDNEYTIFNGKDKRFLGYADGRATIFWDADIEKIVPQMRNVLKSGQDALPEFAWQGSRYLLRDGGHAVVTGEEEEYEMKNWLYEDEERKNLVSINSYGPMSVEAFVGRVLENFEVSNILPR